MTTEEKAKAYDEALKWMRELYPGLHGATKEDAEHYFPELRESKDERIRRTLVEYFGRYNPKDKWDDEFSFKDVLDYLEKQKELTPADGWDYADKRMSHPLYLEGFEAGRAVEREASESAAEWSEEDEKMIWDIVAVLEADNVENKKKFPYALSLHERYKKMVDWLKSLRPSWKPSEEQMSMLRAVINEPNNSGAESCQIALRGIYEQLKKL